MDIEHSTEEVVFGDEAIPIGRAANDQEKWIDAPKQSLLSRLIISVAYL